MPNLLLSLLLLFSVSFRLSAQNSGCGQPEVTTWFFKTHPELEKQFLESQKISSGKSGNRKSTQSTTEPEFMIPVVFHILHQNGSENISDAQVHDEIRILNRDFQKKNADTAIVVAPFKDIIANVGFGFKLARIDPDGNCTNGIIRHVTPKTNWDANNLNDFIYSWPREKYLNIYIVKTLNITATAYAFLPGTPIQPGADVIVSMHNMVGSIGTGTVANSRVLTHEVGHWFGLQHIWGTSNQPGVVCGDDLVEDTPETKGFITCATNNTGVCNPGIKENVQNYMDYAPCKIMFTNGQSDRMLSFITGSLNGRNNIHTPSNLVATGIASDNFVCSPTVNFKVNSRKKCANSTLTFTSFTQTGSGPFTRLWTFEGGTPATSSDSVVNVVYSNPGSFLVSLKITNGSGMALDSREEFITIGDQTSGENLPFAFDFETDSLVTKLHLENFDPNSLAWEHNTSLGANGTGKCFFLNSINDLNEIQGEKDAFELPPLNLTGLDEVNMSFWYAYARPTAAQRDSFKVQYSLDCGGNWTTINSMPSVFQMATASGGIVQDEFIPTASQWVQQTIAPSALSAIANRNGLKIRFLFVKDINKTFANNIYIDEIQVNGPLTAMNSDIRKLGITIFPNPSSGSFTVRASDDTKSGLEAKLFDTRGMEIKGKVEKTKGGELLVNSGNDLSKGIYNLMLNLDGQFLPQKLVVN